MSNALLPVLHPYHQEELKAQLLLWVTDREELVQVLPLVHLRLLFHVARPSFLPPKPRTPCAFRKDMTFENLFQQVRGCSSFSSRRKAENFRRSPKPTRAGMRQPLSRSSGRT